MRRELTTVFAALATLITLAFVVPLGLTARDRAQDRALDAGRAVGARLVPVVATGQVDAITPMVEALNGTGPEQVTVLVGGSTIGPPIGLTARTDEAASRAASSSGPADGGVELVSAVAGPGGTGVIRVLVPDRELRRGVLSAWMALAGVGLVLIVGSVAVADRIAQRIIQPARNLADAAHRLGAGELDVSVPVAGPRELTETAAAFNHLTGQVRSMLAAERELVSELTHRLRTPLTRLRIDLDRVSDPDLARQLHRAVDAVTDEVNGLIAQARRTVDPPRPIDVAAVAHDRFEFWSVLAAEEDRACRLVVPAPGRAPAVAAVDPDELAAALDVLIENVFAHTDRGVAFELSVDGGGPEPVAVTVDDAGPGFDPALAEAGRSGTGSTGLGLSIVERLVRSTGGTVAITASPLGGARIRCRLGPAPAGGGPSGPGDRPALAGP